MRKMANDLFALLKKESKPSICLIKKTINIIYPLFNSIDRDVFLETRHRQVDSLTRT